MFEKREYYEAYNVAKEIHYNLCMALQELNTSSNFGVADMLFNSLMLSFVKRAKMHDADRYLDRVAVLTKQLQKELNDIDMTFENDVLRSSHGEVLDIFFDNIFSDLSTQSRIEEAKAQVNQFKFKIEQLMQNLERYM